jgi:hypothetical protein
VAELALERAAELRERRPAQVQSLEDDRRPVLELREDALDLGRAGERFRPPRDILRVRGDLELGARLGETEARVAKPAGREQPLDILDGEEVVEEAPLGSWDDERLPLPIAVEELLGGNRIEGSS